jgi:hypothetical protein
MPPDDRVLLPCDCAGSCSILSAEVIDVTEARFWFEFYEASDRRCWLRTRATAAWKLLFGREHTMRGVCITSAGARELRDLIDRHLVERRT